MDFNKLLEKIKSTGYWKVIIRPTEFRENRISSRDECARAVKESQIRLRGWYYPHIDQQDSSIFYMGNDSVGSFCDWEEKIEYWRFYQNGQFIHYFAIDEDYRLAGQESQGRMRERFHLKDSEENDKFLEILDTLYTVTEIFLFASNLAAKADLGPEVEVEIELADVGGRTLFIWDQRRILFEKYTCKFHNENIIKRRIVKVDELFTNSLDYALDVAVDIMKDFNWLNVNRDIFSEDQRKLVERRI